MNQRGFYILELFSKIKPVLKQSILLHCPTEAIEFFAIDLGMAKSKSVDVSARKLKRHETSIENIC